MGRIEYINGHSVIDYQKGGRGDGEESSKKKTSSGAGGKKDADIAADNSKNPACHVSGDGSAAFRAVGNAV